MAIACTSQGVIQQIAKASAWAQEHQTRRWDAPFELPWPTFFEDVSRHINEITTVALRPRRKVSGQLHEQTFYSRRDDGRYSVRKRLDALSEKDVERVIDPHVRSLIRGKLVTCGLKDPKKAFAAGANPIELVKPDGSETVIRKVRVLVSVSPLSVGTGNRLRLTPPGGNHHMAVYETVDGRGRTVWKGYVTTLFEAKRRTVKKEPVVSRDSPERGRFLFSIASGDVVCLTADGRGTLWRVRSTWVENGKARIELTPLNDAREKKLVKAEGLAPKYGIDTLRNLNCRKVCFTPLGEIRWDNT